MVKLGFVIPVLNQFQLALETVDSIKTKYAHKVYVERNYNVNQGVAAAWNSGAQRAFADGADIVFILNDDIVISPEAIDHMVDVLWGDDSIGILTGTDHRNSMTPEQVASMSLPDYEVDILDAPDFAFFAFTKQSYNWIGNFDTNFHPAYFEDNDYVIRCIRSGLYAFRSQRAAFYHYGSRTQNANGQNSVVPSPVFEQNRNYFVNKWGGLPGEESYDHPFNNIEMHWFNF